MWTRLELKSRAKKSFSRFYWGAVVVCLAAFLFTNEFGNNSGSAGGAQHRQETAAEHFRGEAERTTGIVNSLFHNSFIDSAKGLADETLSPLEKMGAVGKTVSKFIKAPFIVMLYAVPLVFSVLMICFRILIGNPLNVGCKRYFMKNRQQETRVGEITYGFANGYGNIASTMFCVDLFTALWSLLLVVPGIVKSYEYRMVPYILCENPKIDRRRAFELSRIMMDGQKWNTFVLDLSFILWSLLGTVTLQLANIFYVHPYMSATNAELYAVLRRHAKLTDNIEDWELPGFRQSNS